MKVDSDWFICPRAPRVAKQCQRLEDHAANQQPSCVIYVPRRSPWRHQPGQEAVLANCPFSAFSRPKVVSEMSTAPGQRVVFGSSQERRVFPLHFAPDRLGNQMSRREAPHLGPGCYDNHEVRLLNVCRQSGGSEAPICSCLFQFGTMIYDLRTTPGSKRGYGLSARTAARFPPCNKVAKQTPAG